MSIWLSDFPLKRYGFTLTKSIFRDGLRLLQSYIKKKHLSIAHVRKTQAPLGKEGLY